MKVSPYFVDMLGQRFGRWTVIAKAEIPPHLKNRSGESFWLCKCDCGNEKVVCGYSLKSGKSQSCGCLRIDICKNDPPRGLAESDLTGMKIGRLTVLKKVNTSGRSMWLCKCDCGNEKVVRATALKRMKTLSCGCLIHDTLSLPEGEAAFNRLYENYSNNSKNRGISFELDKNSFREITKENCYYCGSKPSYIMKSKHKTGTYIYNGIDRVDNTLGYVLENVVPCCGICNKAKMAMSREDFLSWIEKVYNHSIKN